MRVRAGFTYDSEAAVGRPARTVMGATDVKRRRRPTAAAPLDQIWIMSSRTRDVLPATSVADADALHFDRRSDR